MPNPTTDVIRIDRYTIGGDPVERVAYGKWENSGPAIHDNVIINGLAQEEWDRCITLAEERGIAHLLDPICLRDHCLNTADGEPTDPNQAARRTKWDIRAIPIAIGVACSGVAVETYVPA